MYLFIILDLAFFLAFNFVNKFSKLKTLHFFYKFASCIKLDERKEKEKYSSGRTENERGF